MTLLGITNKMIEDCMDGKNNKYYMHYDGFDYEIEPIFYKADDLDRDCKTDYIVQNIILKDDEFTYTIIGYFGLSECLYADYYFKKGE